MWSDGVETQFLYGIMQMLSHSQQTLCGPGEFINLTWGTSSYHEISRSQLADGTLGDWLFSVDTDHMMAPDLLERLLFLRSKYQTRVLSGIYAYKHPPYMPVANNWAEVDGKLTVQPLKTWDLEADIIEIGPCGGGCLLVDRTVFEEIHEKLGEPPFQIIPGLSEDYSFFARCRRLGIKTYLAPKVQSHHMRQGRALIDIRDYVESWPPPSPKGSHLTLPNPKVK